jgi:predicted permease
MPKLRSFLVRLFGLFRSRNYGDEFAAELESHVAMDTEAGIRAGLNPEEARRQALVRLGGAEQTRQAHRERGTLLWIEDLLHDLRYGLRMMARNRSFTAVAVITLAVGIGATTTAFTWINSVMLQPLGGVAEPNRLVDVESVTPGGEWVPSSYPDFIDFRTRLKLIDGMAVTHPVALSVGKEDHAERVWAELVSGNFFSVLGVQPEVGRLFLPSEFADAPGKFPIVVISDRYWRAHFNADPSIVGRTILINQHQLTVVGVAAPAFHGSIPVTAFDLWVPYMEQPALNSVQEWMLRDRHNRNMLGIARLKQGVTIEQARAELKSLAGRMAIANADVSEGMSATLLPLWQSPHGPQGLLVGPLRILMGVSILVLLIVCANVANLLLARATVREKEFTARLALGASRARLARQVLTESLLLTGTGAVLGLIVTPWMGHALRYLMPPGPMQQLVAMDSSPNLSVLAFSAGVCVVAALAAGLIPALQVGRLNLSSRLNAGGRSGAAGRGRNRLRSTLVASEVALALVALVVAGLFARSFQTTMRIDPGFDPNHVLLSQFYLNTNGYSLQQRKEFCRRLADRMLSAPGVTDVAYSDGVPLSFEPSWWEELKIDGYAPRPNENMSVFRNVISPGYLPLMRIPILDGRNFTEEDNETQKVGAMIVNQAFVRRFFPGRNPIGVRVHGWGNWFRIVGIAQDSKYHYLGESAPAYFYVPFLQIYREDMNLAFYVRTRGEPDYVLSTLRAQARDIDPNVVVFDAAPLKEYIGASLYPQKIAASLMTVLGSIALLLAAVGLYSVMAYSVAQRTQEIGVRMALGAQRSHVLLMVIRQGLALTSVGLIVGAVLAIGLARVVSSVSVTGGAMGVGEKLIGAGANNPVVYLAAAVFLCAVATLASWLPARRAAAIDPMNALRAE